MKKTIFMFAAVLAAMVSCQKAENESVSPNLTKITVVAENSLGDPETKMTIGDPVDGACPVLWNAGDVVKLIDRTAGSRPIIATVTIPSEYDKQKGAQLTFEADLSGMTAGQQLVLMIAPEGIKYGDNKVVPQDQVQKSTGAENTNFIGCTYAFTASTSLFDGNGKMKKSLSFAMRHPFAYVKIPFYSEKFAGYKLVSMSLSNTEASKDNGGWVSGSVNVDGSKSSTNAITEYRTSVTPTNCVNLTFSDDVYVTNQSQEAWMVALPTKLNGKTFAEGEVKPLYAVTFVMEKDGVTVTAVVKFRAELKPSGVNVLNVGNIVEGDVTESEDIHNDFFKMYEAGMDITIGDLVVNKETYSSYSLKKPSEITLALLQAGGLIFIDDEEGTAVIDLSTPNSTSTNKTLPSTKGLVLIGRYKVNGKQTSLKLDECRTAKDLAIMNLKLSTSRSEQFFAKTSTDKVQTALRLQDCYIDNSNTVKLIEDTQAAGAASYSIVAIDNCVIKLPDTKQSYVFRTRNFDYAAQTSIKVSITNNVIYTPSLKDYQSQVFSIYSPDNAGTGNIVLNVSNNTILNLHGNDAIIRRGVHMNSANITIGGNLVVADNTDNNPVIITANNQNVYFLKNTETLSAGNNFLTTINYTGAANTIQKSKMYSLKKAETDIVEQTDNPFTSLNYINGYFPVKTSVVTNGAGASYDTKYFVVK